MTGLNGRTGMELLYRLTIFPRLTRFPRLANIPGRHWPPILTTLTRMTSKTRQTRLLRMFSNYGAPGFLRPCRAWPLFWSSRWFRVCLGLAFSFFLLNFPLGVVGGGTSLTGPYVGIRDTADRAENRLECAKPPTEPAEMAESEIQGPYIQRNPTSVR